MPSIQEFSGPLEEGAAQGHHGAKSGQRLPTSKPSWEGPGGGSEGMSAETLSDSSISLGRKSGHSHACLTGAPSLRHGAAVTWQASGPSLDQGRGHPQALPRARLPAPAGHVFWLSGHSSAGRAFPWAPWRPS